ncbi:hypothetical protein CRUP_023078 [Coryphaenoides rupestris]|nr:hypothetical protein CRUP_023078 [Coryphaenoides rupestris]
MTSCYGTCGVTSRRGAERRPGLANPRRDQVHSAGGGASGPEQSTRLSGGGQGGPAPHLVSQDHRPTWSAADQQLRMHLQADPPLQRSPKRDQQGAALRTPATCNRGNMGGATRHPFSVLSNNTPHRHGGTAASQGVNHHRRGDDKLTYPLPTPTSPGCHDDPEEAWSVVRPGHVREKIALFAPPLGVQDLGEVCSPAGAGLKAKGGWGVGSRSAKRARRSGGGGRRGEQQDQEAEEEEEVSVGEMVAFLEQQMSSAPLLALQRSSASITLAPPPGPTPRTGSGSEVTVEGSEVAVEAVRVWDLVARLESECVKSRTGPDRGLLRGVARVLLTQSSSSSSPSSSPSSSSPPSSSAPPAPLSDHVPEPRDVVPMEAGELAQTEVQRLQGSPQTPADPQTPSCEEEEEPPGKLFFSQSLIQNSQHTSTSSSSQPPGAPVPPPTSLLLLCSPDSCGAPEARRCSPGGGGGGQASHRFLEARFRLQLLLEPQSSLLLLPPHLLLQVLSLLPTRSLAALQLCCRQLCSLIRAGGVRPADSRWVGDPRYRDDPCKQCKRRYCRGDVSLCRWHHKPYCQALPYGPGYWMCCHGARKDSPGCNALNQEVTEAAADEIMPPGAAG